MPSHPNPFFFLSFKNISSLNHIFQPDLAKTVVDLKKNTEKNFFSKKLFYT